MIDQLSAPPYGEKEIRCPKLGSPVTFEYCRIENENVPCSRAITCWSAWFDVASFMRSELTAEEFQKAFETPNRPKIVTLVDLIAKARTIVENKQNE